MTVVGLCALAGFSRQAFYKEREVQVRARLESEVIVEGVRELRRIHPKMGARKLHYLLGPQWAAAGIELGRDRFFALLREEGLLIECKRTFVRTTNSRHGFAVYRNLIGQIEPSMPNQVWVSDLTYVATDEGFLYLSLVTDSYSRKIVGFDVSDTLEAEGCVRALQMALKSLPPGQRPIHHSDRGTQYCCAAYVGLLRSNGLAISMTEQNHCYENAQAERVNGILKAEYGLGGKFRFKQQARAASAQAVRIYNELRPHLALDYQTPAQVYATEQAA